MPCGTHGLQIARLFSASFETVFLCPSFLTILYLAFHDVRWSFLEFVSNFVSKF